MWFCSIFVALCQAWTWLVIAALLKLLHLEVCHDFWVYSVKVLELLRQVLFFYSNSFYFDSVMTCFAMLLKLNLTLFLIF